MAKTSNRKQKAKAAAKTAAKVAGVGYAARLEMKGNRAATKARIATVKGDARKVKATSKKVAKRASGINAKTARAAASKGVSTVGANSGKIAVGAAVGAGAVVAYKKRKKIQATARKLKKGRRR